MVSQNYHAIVRELEPSEGGGYLVEFPDLPGCMADGATREEALRKGDLAKAEWLETAKKLGRKLPDPKPTQAYSGKFNQLENPPHPTPQSPFPRRPKLRLLQQKRGDGKSTRRRSRKAPKPLPPSP